MENCTTGCSFYPSAPQPLQQTCVHVPQSQSIGVHVVRQLRFATLSQHLSGEGGFVSAYSQTDSSTRTSSAVSVGIVGPTTSHCADSASTIQEIGNYRDAATSPSTASRAIAYHTIGTQTTVQSQDSARYVKNTTARTSTQRCHGVTTTTPTSTQLRGSKTVVGNPSQPFETVTPLTTVSASTSSSRSRAPEAQTVTLLLVAVVQYVG